jgi:HEPN domain-containing protein
MKGLKLLLLSILILAAVITITGQADAATNVFVNGSLPNNTLYQGQVYSLNLTVKNNENYPVRIYSVGVNYDWMKSDIFYTLDKGSSYTQVESNKTTSIGNIIISCDNTVSTGYHAYFYKLELTWYNQYMNEWINETVIQPGSLYIESPMKNLALTDLQEANQSLTIAKAANYSSIRAKADIANCTANLNAGWNAYNSNDFSRAINLTYTIIIDLNDIKIAEKDYADKKSQVDAIVSSVNEKMSVVQGVTSPDAKDLVSLARGYLNTTQQNILNENWDAAKQNARMAEQSVDSASNAEFFYRLQSNNTAAEKDSATRAIQSAQDSVQNADAIVSSGSAGNILNDAKLKLQEANQALSSDDYSNATVKANVATALATQAISEEASYRIGEARSKISSVGELKSADAKGIFNQANTKYNQSQSAYNSGDYQAAIDNASQAYRLANDTAALELGSSGTKATPGFESVYAIAALLAVFFISGICARRERKD